MTDTTTTAPATAPRGPVPLPPAAARLLIATGAVGTIASTFLSWTWTPAFPGDLISLGQSTLLVHYRMQRNG